MIKVKAIYKPNNTELSRQVHSDDDLPMIVGEMLYGIRVQNNEFDVDGVFRTLDIPRNYVKNKTIVNDSQFKITISNIKNSILKEE